MSSTGARGRKSVESRVIEGAIKNEEEFIQSLKVFGNNNAIGSNPGESLGGSLPTAGEASNAKVNDLGLISGDFLIDFAVLNDRSLTANVNGNLTITFTNIPSLLFLNLRLYIRSTDPIITIGGIIVSGVGSSPLITTEVDDFLDISIGSIDQSTIFIGSVKKNDKTEEPPGIPLNVNAIGNSASTIKVIWDPPPLGSQPIKYDIAYSLSSAGTPANGPDTHAPGSPDIDIITNLHTITGLVSATTYFVWIRAKNDLGNSDYVGPFQTNTDGISNPGGVNFAIPGGSVLFDSITATWDQPGGALFTLIRTNTVTGEIEILQDFDVSDADVVDDTGIDPNTNYDYKLTVFNGFGAILGSGTINVTSADLPVPVFVLTAQGQRLRFNVTFPAEISLAEVEWAFDSGFTSGQVTKKFPRPLGDWTISSSHDFDTQILSGDTQFFGRARLQKEQEIGPNAANQDVTTAVLLSPSKPILTVTSPATGQIRIKVKYVDSPTRNERALVTWRLQSSVQEYFETIYKIGTTIIENAYDRDFPPSDDLNALEDRVEVIREGAFNPGDAITVRCVCTNPSGTSPADSANVIVDS